MSYRNDHDAALARIDALEAELERVTRERPVDMPVAQPRRGALYVALAATIALGTVFGYVQFNRGAAHRPERPVAAAPIANSDIPSFDSCRAQITHPVGLSAGSTDPRGAAHDVHAVVRTGAQCREALARSHDPALARWLRAENELAGDISRIVVYYEHDPYVLDNYSTAGQLWKEYDADIVARDAALAQLQPNS